MPPASLCRLGTAAPAVPAPSLPAASLSRRRRRRAPAAAPDADAAPAAAAPTPPPARPAAPRAKELPLEFPKRGLFALADPTAEVYGKAGAEPFDPTVKPKGRYAPEFLWNTDWRGTLRRQEDLERQTREYAEATRAGGGGGAVAPAPMVAGGALSVSAALPALGGGAASPGVAAALAERRAAQRGAGRVALSRLAVLDDLGADLSADLAEAAVRRRAEDARKRAAREGAERAAAEAAAAFERGERVAVATASASAPRRRPRALPAGDPNDPNAPAAASPSYRLKDLPSRGELRRFARATRSANAAASATAVSAAAQMAVPPEEREARTREAAEANDRYERLKVGFQAWTLGMGCAGTVCCYCGYSPQTAASYAIGAASGLAYLRLLGRSVDSLGGGSAGAGSATLGQPRLLVPVAMALAYNRWNTLYAGEVGLALELLPMLAGFFTFKLAVISRQGLELLSELSAGAGKEEEGAQEGAAAAAGGSGSGGGAFEGARGPVLREGYVAESMTLDRIFVKRVIKEM